MARFEHLKGLFGLLPTPYTEDLEIHTADLKSVANFCCESGQHGIVWPVMVGEFYFLGEEERVRNLDAVLEEVNGRLPVVFGCRCRRWFCLQGRHRRPEPMRLLQCRL